MAARNDVIDGFRGIAIVGVLVYHYFYAWQKELGAELGSPWLQLGALGVQFFFVISGLVITMTLLRSDDALKFLIRRLARLVPALWVACIVIFVFLEFFDPFSFDVDFADLITSFIFIPTELGNSYVDGAFWSLNIEIKFYLLVAFSYFVLRKNFWIGIIGFALMGCVVGVFTQAGQRSLFLGPYLPFFIIGLGIWYFFYEKKLRISLVCGFSALFLYAYHFKYYVYVGLPVWAPTIFVAFVILVFIVAIAFFSQARLLGLSWLGRISYSLYLIHQRVGVVLISMLMASGLSQTYAASLVVVLAVAVAWVFYRFVELPGQSLILSLFNRKKSI